MPLAVTRFPTRQRPMPLSWLAELLRLGFVLALFLFFLLPGKLLLLLDWHYVGGGPEYQKIHVATYLIILVFGLMLIVDMRFRDTVIAACLTEYSFVSFAISAAATALFAIVVRHVSIAPFVDTLGAAIIGTLGCICLPVRYMRILKRLLDTFFVANIAIVFYEYYTKSSIIGSYALSDYQAGFRASGLFEAQLSAASLLGLYALLNLISIRISFSLECVVRLSLAFLSLTAVVTTGGRSALLATIIIGIGFLFVSFMRQVRRGYFNKAGMVYFVVAIPFAIVGVSVFVWLGVFDTIAARFRDDIGSALSRQLALDLLFNMSNSELIFGLSAGDVLNLISVQAELGLIAIEISWVNFVLVCGLVFTIPLLITFTLFLFRFLPRYCGRAVYAPSLLVLINSSASNGIWAKTTVLTASLVLMISFLTKIASNIES